MHEYSCIIRVNERSIPVLRQWHVKFLLIFGVCLALEIGQYYGYYNVGHTFDPLDILVYALGTGLAVWIDQRVFKRYLCFGDQLRILLKTLGVHTTMSSTELKLKNSN